MLSLVHGPLLTVERGAGALVLVKAVDVVLRGPATGVPLLWAAAAVVFIAGGVLLLCGRGRALRGGWAVVLVGAVLVAVEQPLELRLQHLVLLGLAALVAVVARDDGERRLLWRAQLSALYGFAALAKLNEGYLAGDPLAGSLRPAGLPTGVVVVIGVGLLLLEVVLAVAAWRERWLRTGLVLAGSFHLIALLVVSGGPVVTLRLVVFGGTAVLLWAAVAGVLASAGPVRPSRRPVASGR